MASRSVRSKSERSKRTSAASRGNVIPIDEGLKSDRVYRDLRRRIRALQLQPGSRLDKNLIADEYSVSRAPVSEAIARLAVEGLVDVVPQSGSFVAPIRLEDVRESLLVRTGLEVEIVRRATSAGSDEILDRLEENLEVQVLAVRRSDFSLLDDSDSAFHGIILNAVNSPAVGKLVDRARAILDRPRFYALPEEGRPNATVAEHRRIVDAIRTRDVELAAAAMRVHLTMVAKSIERNIAHMQAEAVSKAPNRARP